MLDLGAEQLQHPAGAGADIEQIGHALQLDEALERGLDLLFRYVQAANRRPLMGVAGKVCGGVPLAVTLDLGQAHTIAERRRIIDGHQLDQPVGHRFATARQPIEDPIAFPKPLEQAALAQELEVPGHARLTLPQNRGQLGHGQLVFRTEDEKSKPSRLRRRPQPRQQFFHRPSSSA